MKRFLRLCLALALGIGSAHAQQYAKFRIEPRNPKGGDRITIHYRPDSLLDQHAGITGVFYIYDSTYHWQAIFLPMKKFSDTSYQASLTLPGAAGLLACRFTDGIHSDNDHDQGYAWMVFMAEGPIAAGGEAGWGLLRTPSYGLGVPGYYHQFSISDTATYMWLSNELIRHPRLSKKELIIPYLKAAFAYKKEEAVPITQRAVAFLSADPNPTELLLVKLMIIKEKFLKDTAGADTIRKQLVQQFPRGLLTFQDAYLKTIAGKDMNRQYQLCRSFIDTYPPDSARQTACQLLDIDYDRVYRNLFMIAIAKQDTTTLLQYIPQAPLNRIADIYYKAVQIPYESHKSASAAQISPMAAAVMARIEIMRRNKPWQYWYMAPVEWAPYIDSLFKGIYLTQAQIAFETGHINQAMQLAEKAQYQYQYTRAVLNDLQVRILTTNGNKKKAKEVLEKGIRLNQATGAMISILKENYLSSHPGKGEADFDRYLASLKDARTMELLKESVLAGMRKDTAAGFSLKALDGTLVSLASLKGKVVVLDFWASWCAPCKAGMAGMKLVVDKYKNDSNVVFLFIDTQEHGTDYVDKARKFLQQMHYENFRVLFDNGDETYARYATQIHTSGIPFKVVINPQGKLNFANVGYQGSPTGLADEIEMMIELARKAGAPEQNTSPLSYRSRDVFYNNDSIRFAGTLTLPGLAEGQHWPAVLLLSGTGPQDRNGTMAGHPFFGVLADYLTRKGIAVLRVDDRGVGATSGGSTDASQSELMNDALAGIRYLRTCGDIDSNRVGLIGHSEGGSIACMAAASSKDVAFVISLSGMGIRGIDALLLQNKAIVDNAPITAINKQRFHEANQIFLTTAYEHAASSDMETALRKAYAAWRIADSAMVAKVDSKETDHFFYPFEGFVRQAIGKWYRSFISFDPAAVFPRVHVPVLAINGDKDIISAARPNLAGFRKYIPSNLLETWEVPGVNHLYQHCKTCDTREYAKLEETLAPEVLDKIVRFIHDRSI